MNTYDIGDVARVRSAFTVEGAATDPTTVTLWIKDPAGTETSYTYALSQLTRVSAGVFYRDISCSAAGIWTYRFVGTGACIAAGKSTFRVSSDPFTTH